MGESWDHGRRDVGCEMKSEPPSRVQGCELAVFGMCFVSGFTAVMRVGGSGVAEAAEPCRVTAICDSGKEGGTSGRDSHLSNPSHLHLPVTL